MTNNLYWTASGTNKNAYDDGFLHNYKAVKGNDIKVDFLNEFDLFTYSDNQKTFIVLKDIGVAIVSAENLDSALDKLHKLVDHFGINGLTNEIKEQLKIRKAVPTTLPMAENEIIELDVCISNKTGEPNESHTKWYKQKQNN